MIIVRDRVSNGARKLVEYTGARLFKPRARPFNRAALVVNWGNVNSVNSTGVLLNSPASIRNASDKLRAFSLVGTVANVPEHYTNANAVPERDKKSIWLARRNNTSGGRGITIVRGNDPLPRADFYSKYVRKSAEYRVHVVRGQVILVQQKVFTSDNKPDKDFFLIRNHDNGWVFTSNSVQFPSPEVETEVRSVATRAVRALGLDFAGVDIIIEKGTNNVYFLEANTKPGIETDSAASAYGRAFLAIERERRRGRA